MEKLMLIFGQIFSLGSIKTKNIVFKILEFIKVAGKIHQNLHSNGFFHFA